MIVGCAKGSQSDGDGEGVVLFSNIFLEVFPVAAVDTAESVVMKLTFQPWPMKKLEMAKICQDIETFY